MKNQFLSKVFLWLGIGLFVSFGLGYAITLDVDLLFTLIDNFTIITILEIVIAIVFSLMLNKLSDTVAKILYLVYSALTGVTFSVIFMAFEMSSILWVLLATAIIFGVFALIGSKLKIDLSGFGTFLLIALFGMIILSLINMFVLDAALDMTICFVSILIFSGFITYDINRILKLSKFQIEEKYAVFWAFQLYLDIINIILDLLSLGGKRKD
ncbi:MAG: Bax inhibitor-1/YccA family protein [Firmicutes bacterium]|nr:Bax inhibitor-1/YccA family protein [Bacillota bacterium]